MTQEEAKQKIAELVNKYQVLDSPKLKSFNEAATKQGFVQPLFEALGWDFGDTDEVSPEDDTSTGRVDYAFKLHSVSQFFVEAKPFKEDVNDPKHIKQAVSYAYNKGITWAVLTNFQALRVFNAQKTEPFIALNCGQYIPSFERLWLLSKESLESGLLTKEAISWGALPIPMPIEKRLFTKLREWREILFNQIFLYNDKMHLDRSQVDDIIQKLFNRFIFIRTAEDRGIEEKGLLALLHQWKSAGGKERLIDAVRQLFKEYDGYYDSELFDQNNSHLLDNPSIFVENEVIESILNGLYEIPGSWANYNFNDIDVDMLGAVYEQYLGHVAEVIKQRAKEAQARMELGIGTPTYTLTDKKERRKEHGMYYTPKYITDFIVKETVGRFLRENAYNPNNILNLKILDPACGSGSFLIRAYDELLKYHANERKKPVHMLGQRERLPILTNNIYGVDLDKQAVEIARLNLLLRSLSNREPLPNLGDNIKRGNSLIFGTTDEMEKWFGEAWVEKHPFNWDVEFKDIIDNGGFDIVIGNPPYGAEFDENDRSYINDHYLHSKDNKNSAMVFIEKALSLTKEGGYFSFIIPKSLAYSQKWANGRKLLLEKLGHVVDTSKAFKEVLLEQMVVVVSQNFSHNKYYESANLNQNGKTVEVSIQKQITAASDTILLGINSEELNIFKKMITSQVFMKDISRTARGLPFQRYLITKGEGELIYRGDHIGRYRLYESKEMLSKSTLENAKEKISFLRQTKIMSQQIIAHVQKPVDHIILMSTLDNKGILTLDTVQNTILTNKKYPYGFVLALLNSTLWSWYAYRFIYSKAVRTMHFDGYYISKFPLPTIDFTNKLQNKELINISHLAESITDLNQKLVPFIEVNSNQHDDIVHEIERLEKEIDSYIFQLYCLTESEIKIVNGLL